MEELGEHELDDKPHSIDVYSMSQYSYVVSSVEWDILISAYPLGNDRWSVHIGHLGHEVMVRSDFFCVHKEIWNTQMTMRYDMNLFLQGIISLFSSEVLDVEYPIQLVYNFGGTLHGRSVPAPIIRNSH